jgi:hypothetical protein
MENQINDQKPWHKRTWVIIVGIILILALIVNVSCLKDGKSNSSTNNSPDTVAIVTDEPISSTDNSTDSFNNEEKEPKSNWSYTEDVDKMTNNKTYFASSESTNQIKLESPYEGGSTFTLTVRNLGEGNEIILHVSKGMFYPSVFSNKNCRIKFDEEQTLNCSYNTTGLSSVILFDNSNEFLEKLKTANKLKIEAPFWDDSRQVIEFDVAGLTWEK